MTLDKFKELKKQQEVLAEEVERQSRAAFEDGSRLIFDKHVNLNSFGWTQYTDFFNDGDPCRFHVHSDSLSLNGFNAEDESAEGLDEEAVCEDIWALLDCFSTDDLESLFGDHVEVSVTRDGIEISDYSDHD